MKWREMLPYIVYIFKDETQEGVSQHGIDLFEDEICDDVRKNDGTESRKLILISIKEDVSVCRPV